MPISSTPTRPLSRFLILSLLLLTQMLGMVAPHHAEDDGVVLLQGEELLGRTYQPAARHPEQAAHMEPAEAEHHSHPCAACLHLVGSLAAFRPASPGLDPPPPGRPAFASRFLFRSRAVSPGAGPRAPPCLA